MHACFRLCRSPVEAVGGNPENAPGRADRALPRPCWYWLTDSQRFRRSEPPSAKMGDRSEQHRAGPHPQSRSSEITRASPSRHLGGRRSADLWTYQPEPLEEVANLAEVERVRVRDRATSKS